MLLCNANLAKTFPDKTTVMKATERINKASVIFAMILSIAFNTFIFSLYDNLGSKISHSPFCGFPFHDESC